MRYLIYARRSQEREDRQIQSIEDQLELTRRHARHKDLAVSQEITESRSAKEPEQRPEFAHLLRLVEGGKADGILAWHPDRLSRNELDAARLVYLVRKGRLHLEFVNYNFDPSPEGIMMLQMALSQSQYYSSKLAKDVWRGMNSKIERGWSPFRAPEGYWNDAETRTIVSDPERFPLIRAAWERLLTGAYSVPEVVETLNEAWGYTTRPSKRTVPSLKRHGGGPLSLPSAYKLFHNPFYTGHFVVSGVTHQGQHPPMVTAAEFGRVQELLARGGGRRRYKHEFAYSGLLECARCGCRVTVEVQTGKYKPGRYVYYHCTNRLGGCSKAGIREEALEVQIEALLGSVTIGSEVAAFALMAVDKWQKAVLPDGKPLTVQREEALSETERQIGALLDLRLRGTISDELFENKQAQLQARVQKLRLARQEAEEEMSRVRASACGALKFMADAHAQFLVGTMREKREIARALGLRYALDRGNVTIETHPALPPHLLLIPQFSENKSDGGTNERPNQGLKNGVKNGHFELGKDGSGSTKKAAFCAAFSSGGPIESYSEHLWNFFSVKPSFTGAPCLSNNARDRSTG